MALDRTTEAISHFAGWFHLSVDQARARAEYEYFKLKRAEEADALFQHGRDFSVKHEYKLESYDPGLSYTPKFYPLPDGPVAIPELPALPSSDGVPLSLSEPVLVRTDLPSFPTIKYNFELPAPSSVAGVTVQSNFLTDNDIYGPIAKEIFANPEAFNAPLAVLAKLAAELHPTKLLGVNPEDMLEIAHDLIAQIEQIAKSVEGTETSESGASAEGETQGDSPNPIEGAGSPEGPAHISVFLGEDTQGYTANGVKIESLPEWEELWPAFLKPEPTPEEAIAGTQTTVTVVEGPGQENAEHGASSTWTRVESNALDGSVGDGSTETVTTTTTTTDTNDPAAHDLSLDFGPSHVDPTEGMELGHHIVTGANTLINSVTINSTWLDASVFVVGGDAISLDVISQVGILVSHTAGATTTAAVPLQNVATSESTARVEDTSETVKTALELLPEIDPLANNVVNIAGFVTKSSEAGDTSENAAQAESAPGESGDPIATTPENSVAGTGAIASDGISVSAKKTIQIEKSETSSTATDAEVTDDQSHNGPPLAASVVRVEADLLQINSLHQYSFITDNDLAQINLSGNNTFLGFGQNQLFNAFNTSQIGFNYDLIVVGGNMISINHVAQTNVLLEADAVTFSSPTLEPTSPSSLPEPETEQETLPEPHFPIQGSNPIPPVQSSAPEKAKAETITPEPPEASAATKTVATQLSEPTKSTSAAPVDASTPAASLEKPGTKETSSTATSTNTSSTTTTTESTTTTAETVSLPVTHASSDAKTVEAPTLHTSTAETAANTTEDASSTTSSVAASSASHAPSSPETTAEPALGKTVEAGPLIMPTQEHLETHTSIGAPQQDMAADPLVLPADSASALSLSDVQPAADTLESDGQGQTVEAEEPGSADPSASAVTASPIPSAQVDPTKTDLAETQTTSAKASSSPSNSVAEVGVSPSNAKADAASGETGAESTILATQGVTTSSAPAAPMEAEAPASKTMHVAEKPAAAEQPTLVTKVTAPTHESSSLAEAPAPTQVADTPASPLQEIPVEGTPQLGATAPAAAPEPTTKVLTLESTSSAPEASNPKPSQESITSKLSDAAPVVAYASVTAPTVPPYTSPEPSMTGPVDTPSSGVLAESAVSSVEESAPEPVPQFHEQPSAEVSAGPSENAAATEIDSAAQEPVVATAHSSHAPAPVIEVDLSSTDAVAVVEQPGGASEALGTAEAVAKSPDPVQSNHSSVGDASLVETQPPDGSAAQSGASGVTKASTSEAVTASAEATAIAPPQQLAAVTVEPAQKPEPAAEATEPEIASEPARSEETLVDASRSSVAPEPSETGAPKTIEPSVPGPLGPSSLSPPPPDAGVAPDVTVSTGNNLLYNEAVVNTVGTTTEAPIKSKFVKTLEHLGEGKEHLPIGVKNDSLFDGIEFLRVLYIEGDFITVNNLVQTNILGDSDQVETALSSVAENMANEIIVTTGSNILANLASIQNFGVDSTLMAAGNTYSEALLHQLELVNESAAPAGVSLPGLVNEAVAFLAEGIIEQAMPEMPTAASLIAAMDTGPANDPMQTMVT